MVLMRMNFWAYLHSMALGRRLREGLKLGLFLLFSIILACLYQMIGSTWIRFRFGISFSGAPCLVAKFQNSIKLIQVRIKLLKIIGYRFLVHR